MTSPAPDEAAALLARTLTGGGLLPGLPHDLVPPDRATAYDVQRRRAELLGSDTVGWKIAATSASGQHHIGVDGPLAGRVLADTVHADGDEVPLAGNAMCVAEMEFVFVLAAGVEDLGPGSPSHDATSVASLVADLRLGVELPSTRYTDPATAGAAQLIADNACSGRFVLGPLVAADWRDLDLASTAVRGTLHGLSGARHVQGVGSEVLGHPLAALAWLVDELAGHGIAMRAGQLVTTGTCHTPVAVAPGDRLVAEYVGIGAMACSFR